MASDVIVAVLCGVWILFALGSTCGIASTLRTLKPAPAVSHMPRVAIIAPIKGAGPFLPDFLRRLRAQDYTAARIIVVVESADDPAHAAASAASDGTGLDLSIEIAGKSEAGTGQKVWNLLAGLKALAPDDWLVAFVDADTMPARSWLRRLVEPLVTEKAAIVTGYRWLLPIRNSRAAMLVGAIDHAIASSPRFRFWNMAWGGSVAIPRYLLDQIDIVTWWHGAMSDDMQMTRALWARGLKLVCPDGMLVASPVSHDLASAFEFGRRQHVIARTHLGRWYTLPAVLVLVPSALACVAWIAALGGDVVAIVTIGVVTALGLVRWEMRRRIEGWVLSDADLPVPRVSPWRLIGIVGPFYHMLCFLAALPSRRVRWAGIGYRIVAPQTIEVTRKE